MENGQMVKKQKTKRVQKMWLLKIPRIRIQIGRFGKHVEPHMVHRFVSFPKQEISKDVRNDCFLNFTIQSHLFGKDSIKV